MYMLLEVIEYCSPKILVKTKLSSIWTKTE